MGFWGILGLMISTLALEGVMVGFWGILGLMISTLALEGVMVV
jgi:hypothetical protein